MVTMIINNRSINNERGFTLIELLIVVAILSILAAIAYPSYQGYIEKGLRTDMMAEMHNIATQIESRKLAQGSYRAISAGIIADLAGDYPKQGEVFYTVVITPNPLTSEWVITATPKPSKRMKSDGVISLDYREVKCRVKDGNKKCGVNKDWD